MIGARITTRLILEKTPRVRQARTLAKDTKPRSGKDKMRRMSKPPDPPKLSF